MILIDFLIVIVVVFENFGIVFSNRGIFVVIFICIFVFMIVFVVFDCDLLIFICVLMCVYIFIVVNFGGSFVLSFANRNSSFINRVRLFICFVLFVVIVLIVNVGVIFYVSSVFGVIVMLYVCLFCGFWCSRSRAFVASKMSLIKFVGLVSYVCMFVLCL